MKKNILNRFLSIFLALNILSNSFLPFVVYAQGWEEGDVGYVGAPYDSWTAEPEVVTEASTQPAEVPTEQTGSEGDNWSAWNNSEASATDYSYDPADVPIESAGCTPNCSGAGGVCWGETFGDGCGGTCYGSKDCSVPASGACQDNCSMKFEVCQGSSFTDSCGNNCWGEMNCATFVPTPEPTPQNCSCNRDYEVCIGVEYYDTCRNLACYGRLADTSCGIDGERLALAAKYYGNVGVGAPVADVCEQKVIDSCWKKDCDPNYKKYVCYPAVQRYSDNSCVVDYTQEGRLTDEWCGGNTDNYACVPQPVNLKVDAQCDYRTGQKIWIEEWQDEKCDKYKKPGSSTGEFCESSGLGLSFIYSKVVSFLSQTGRSSTKLSDDEIKKIAEKMAKQVSEDQNYKKKIEEIFNSADDEKDAKLRNLFNLPASDITCNGHYVGESWQGSCNVYGQRTMLSCGEDGAISASAAEDSQCSAQKLESLNFEVDPRVARAKNIYGSTDLSSCNGHSIGEVWAGNCTQSERVYYKCTAEGVAQAQTSDSACSPASINIDPTKIDPVKTGEAILNAITFGAPEYQKISEEVKELDKEAGISTRRTDRGIIGSGQVCSELDPTMPCTPDLDYEKRALEEDLALYPNCDPNDATTHCYLTPEQEQARRDYIKKLKEKGVKGLESAEALADVVTLGGYKLVTTYIDYRKIADEADQFIDGAGIKGRVADDDEIVIQNRLKSQLELDKCQAPGVSQDYIKTFCSNRTGIQNIQELSKAYWELKRDLELNPPCSENDREAAADQCLTIEQETARSAYAKKLAEADAKFLDLYTQGLMFVTNIDVAAPIARGIVKNVGKQLAKRSAKEAAEEGTEGLAIRSAREAAARRAGTFAEKADGAGGSGGVTSRGRGEGRTGDSNVPLSRDSAPEPKVKTDEPSVEPESPVRPDEPEPRVAREEDSGGNVGVGKEEPGAEGPKADTVEPATGVPVEPLPAQPPVPAAQSPITAPISKAAETVKNAANSAKEAVTNVGESVKNWVDDAWGKVTGRKSGISEKPAEQVPSKEVSIKNEPVVNKVEAPVESQPVLSVADYSSQLTSEVEKKIGGGTSLVERDLTKQVTTAYRKTASFYDDLAKKMGGEYHPPAVGDSVSEITTLVSKKSAEFEGYLTRTRKSAQEVGRKAEFEPVYKITYDEAGKPRGVEIYIRDTEDGVTLERLWQDEIPLTSRNQSLGFITTKSAGAAGEDTVRVYRGLPDFNVNVGQEASLVRNGYATVDDVKRFVNGEIDADELFRNYPDKENLLTKMREVMREKPRYSELGAIADLHSSCRAAGIIKCDYSIFLSSATDPYMSFTFAKFDAQISGARGVLVLDIPRSQAIDMVERGIGLGISEFEMAVVGEIKPEWIRGFVPVGKNTSSEAFTKVAIEFDRTVPITTAKDAPKKTAQTATKAEVTTPGEGNLAQIELPSEIKNQKNLDSSNINRNLHGFEAWTDEDFVNGGLDDVLQGAKDLEQAYPGKKFRVFSGWGSSAVIFEEVDNPGILYKVSKPPLEDFNTKEELFARFQQEADNMRRLSEKGLAPKLIEFKGQGQANHAIIAMEKVDVARDGYRFLSAEAREAEISRVTKILEELNLYPGDTEFVVNRTTGRLTALDLAGFASATTKRELTIAEKVRKIVEENAVGSISLTADTAGNPIEQSIKVANELRKLGFSEERVTNETWSLFQFLLRENKEKYPFLYDADGNLDRNLLDLSEKALKRESDLQSANNSLVAYGYSQDELTPVIELGNDLRAAIAAPVQPVVSVQPVAVPTSSITKIVNTANKVDQAVIKTVRDAYDSTIGKILGQPTESSLKHPLVVMEAEKASAQVIQKGLADLSEVKALEKPARQAVAAGQAKKAFFEARQEVEKIVKTNFAKEAEHISEKRMQEIIDEQTANLLGYKVYYRYVRSDRIPEVTEGNGFLMKNSRTHKEQMEDKGFWQSSNLEGPGIYVTDISATQVQPTRGNILDIFNGLEYTIGASKRIGLVEKDITDYYVIIAPPGTFQSTKQSWFGIRELVRRSDLKFDDPKIIVRGPFKREGTEVVTSQPAVWLDLDSQLGKSVDPRPVYVVPARGSNADDLMPRADLMLMQVNRPAKRVVVTLPDAEIAKAATWDELFEIIGTNNEIGSQKFIKLGNTETDAEYFISLLQQIQQGKLEPERYAHISGLYNKLVELIKKDANLARKSVDTSPAGSTVAKPNVSVAAKTGPKEIVQVESVDNAIAKTSAKAQFRGPAYSNGRLADFLVQRGYTWADYAAATNILQWDTSILDVMAVKRLLEIAEGDEESVKFVFDSAKEVARYLNGTEKSISEDAFEVFERWRVEGSLLLSVPLDDERATAKIIAETELLHRKQIRLNPRFQSIAQKVNSKFEESKDYIVANLSGTPFEITPPIFEMDLNQISLLPQKALHELMGFPKELEGKAYYGGFVPHWDSFSTKNRMVLNKDKVLSVSDEQALHTVFHECGHICELDISREAREYLVSNFGVETIKLREGLTEFHTLFFSDDIVERRMIRDANSLDTSKLNVYPEYVQFVHDQLIPHIIDHSKVTRDQANAIVLASVRAGKYDQMVKAAGGVDAVKSILKTDVVQAQPEPVFTAVSRVVTPVDKALAMAQVSKDLGLSGDTAGAVKGVKTSNNKLKTFLPFGLVKSVYAAEEQNQDTKAIDLNTFELLVKKELIRQAIAQDGSVEDDFIENVMKMGITGSLVEDIENGYLLTTDKNGIVDGEIDRNKYEIKVESMDGLDIKVPVSVDVTLGSGVVIPIAVKKGSGRVSQLSDIKASASSSASLKDKSKISLTVFSDDNDNGKLDKDEKILPWAGISVKLTKIIQQKSIPLLAGWNLITIPNNPARPLKASDLLGEIASQGGYATTISILVDGAWNSYVIRGDKTYSGDDFAIEPGKAYFVKALKKSTLIFTGQNFAEPVKLKLTSGWNAVGLPKTSKDYNASTLIDDINSQKGEADTVAWWESGLWDTYLKKEEEGYGNNFAISSGNGYILKVGKETEFTP